MFWTASSAEMTQTTITKWQCHTIASCAHTKRTSECCWVVGWLPACEASIHLWQDLFRRASTQASAGHCTKRHSYDSVTDFLYSFRYFLCLWCNFGEASRDSMHQSQRLVSHASTDTIWYHSSLRCDGRNKLFVKNNAQELIPDARLLFFPYHNHGYGW